MEHRARNHLNRLRRDYTGAFDFLDGCHADRGRDGLPDWPDWCYVPVAAGIAAAQSVSLGTEYASTFAGLAAWRMTQGIYRFDSTLYELLIDTPISGDIPSDALYSLPEWCVYVETPKAVSLCDSLVAGAFVWLEYDVNDSRHELRMLLDIDNMPLQPAIVHLGGTVQDGIDAAILEMEKYSGGLDLGQFDVARAWVEPTSRILSLVLYMCRISDYVRSGKPAIPSNPVKKRTKKGVRLFAAHGPAMWGVGVRMGAALRKAYHERQVALDSSGAGTKVRGHIRRGHWQLDRLGARKPASGEHIPADSRKLTVKWLPPIPVNLDDLDDLPATIRPVKE